MAINRMSVATVSSPEFINITGVSPFASKCEIKVLYLGGNRNGSFINKETATTMAQTLPGCPIVGYYSESKEDFRDHGDQMIIDGDGIKFKCQTVPYGFVAPDTKVWFQDFEDTDEFGNSIIRTYLMTEGYLWTEQYKEAQKVINEGRPQSMELDEKTLKGHWSTDVNRGIDFFIINDAIFSKLCILGEDVEPCFEGSSVTSPDVSAHFTVDEKFTHTLFTMMKELKELTLQNKGGNLMETKDFVVLDDAPAAEVATPMPEVEAKSEPLVEEKVEEIKPAEKIVEKSPKKEGKKDLEDNIEIENNIEEFAKKDEEEKKEDSKEEDAAEDSEEKQDKAADEEDEEAKKKASKNSLEEEYALLEQKYNDLQTEFNALKEENEKLVSFKLDIENKEKDALIDSFYMLSDDDKKNVIENKTNYTLDEIEKELSVICVRKKVNFNSDEEKENNVSLTYNLNDMAEDDTPAWLKAVDERKNIQ